MTLCSYNYIKLENFIAYYFRNSIQINTFEQVNELISNYIKHNTFLTFDENTIGFKPQKARHYLDSLNLQAGKYNYFAYETRFGNYSCCSPYKILDEQSNIAYYLEGNNKTVKKLYLVLNFLKILTSYFAIIF